MEQNEGINVLQGISFVLKEQKQYQEFHFRRVYVSRFAMSLIFLGLLCTVLIHFSVQERFTFNTYPQSEQWLWAMTLSNAGIFNFLIFLVVSFVVLVDALKWKKEIHVLTRQQIYKHNLSDRQDRVMWVLRTVAWSSLLDSLNTDIRTNQTHWFLLFVDLELAYKNVASLKKKKWLFLR